MVKNIRIAVRVTQAEHDSWLIEATKRGKSVSDFLRDCVSRVLGGVESDRIMDKIDDLKNQMDVKGIVAEINALRQSLLESSAIIDGKKAELLRLARETSNPEDNNRVTAWLAAHGRSVLDDIVAGTAVEKSDVYRALQVLVELGTVTCNANKHPTTWELRI